MFLLSEDQTEKMITEIFLDKYPPYRNRKIYLNVCILEEPEFYISVKLIFTH